MESSHSIIEALLRKIKDEMFSSVDLYSFVSPSAYDTAWLAMVPGGNDGRPMFGECLNWVVNNQREGGFWGESDGYGNPTIDCLPATLACMLALKTWGVGSGNLERGLAFIHDNTEKLLAENHGRCPRWFAIVLPAMIELAQKTGLEIVFSDELEEVLTNIFHHRQRILEREELVDKYHYPPLLSYLETLPLWYGIDEEDIVKHLSEDGSMFQSPSATVCAFITTRNRKCMNYLQALVQRFPHGVPSMYPMDEQLIQLIMVDHLQKLGLADHFHKEIENILEHVYSHYMSQEQLPQQSLVPVQIYRDALAFRLLRMHGYHVSPWSFCWFLNHQDILTHMEEDCEYFSSVMYNVYRATDLTFSGEYELQEARSFARKLLKKTLSLGIRGDNVAMFPNFHALIENELDLPWMARLDHLDHRMCIEQLCEINTQWTGKASFYRLSCFHNDVLMQLAVKNYEFRQAIYKSELEELKRWCEDWGLSNMGFGREKTTYCYFAVAVACSFLPHDSEVRMIVAKSGILIIVADDFFDTKGSLNELESLTEAVRRWNGKDLSSHSKTIFAALDNLVSGMAAKHLHQQGNDITGDLQDIWYETFASWLLETKWSKSGYIPSKHEYLDNARISVATQTMVLPASCFLNPGSPECKLKHFQNGSITKLLMVVARLLNDTQSYQKEQEEGKLNFVLLHLKENPKATIEDSISFTKAILDEKRKELLEHALMDDLDDLPKPCKQLHLSCFKVFQMCYNSSNRFDSNTELLHDINRAIYIPLKVQTSKPLKLLPYHARPKKENSKISSTCFDQTYKPRVKPSFIMHRIPPKIRDGCGKVPISLNLKLCFV
ncbi:(E,E)-geranyllinalool synthase-like [Vitis riparia]|uniref:(E,E)-geranyllinalool synthase-like n=1 Tax=Vitis riparia TaxID=96939 RepID=UPI00155AD10B|nr:(E,E)-geranyllinalool synthase-like [Vitis riparia]